MKFKGICLIAGLLAGMLPVLAGAQTPVSSEENNTVPAEQVRKWIDQYIDRYKGMDLDLFMALFTRGAVENRMLPYADIREVYRRTFAETNQFLFYVDIYAIQTYANSAYATGHYKAIQTLKKGNKMKIYQGNIQWDLIREGEVLKIKEITYGRTREE